MNHHSRPFFMVPSSIDGFSESFGPKIFRRVGAKGSVESFPRGYEPLAETTKRLCSWRSVVKMACR